MGYLVACSIFRITSKISPFFPNSVLFLYKKKVNPQFFFRQEENDKPYYFINTWRHVQYVLTHCFTKREDFFMENHIFMTELNCTVH